MGILQSVAEDKTSVSMKKWKEKEITVVRQRGKFEEKKEKSAQEKKHDARMEEIEKELTRAEKAAEEKFERKMKKVQKRLDAVKGRITNNWHRLLRGNSLVTVPLRFVHCPWRLHEELFCIWLCSLYVLRIQ